MLTGDKAQLYRNGIRIGAVKNMAIDVSIEALPASKQGDMDKRFRKGQRTTTLKATLYYDTSDTEAISFINSVYSDLTTAEEITLVYSSDDDLYTTCDCIMTNLGLSINFGAAQMADISLQVVGKPTTIKLEPIDPTAYTYI
jgi:hypothetical protein